jgi:hypothetical protein
LRPHPSRPTPTPRARRPSSILDDGARLELVHKTQVEGIPGALAPFRGRLLAGVGPVLRLFELGRKKLLRKCEYRQLPHHVVQLHAVGSRVFAGDVQVCVWGGGRGGGGQGAGGGPGRGQAGEGRRRRLPPRGAGSSRARAVQQSARPRRPPSFEPPL